MDSALTNHTPQEKVIWILVRSGSTEASAYSLLGEQLFTGSRYCPGSIRIFDRAATGVSFLNFEIRDRYRRAVLNTHPFLPLPVYLYAILCCPCNLFTDTQFFWQSAGRTYPTIHCMYLSALVIYYLVCSVIDDTDVASPGENLVRPAPVAVDRDALAPQIVSEGEDTSDIIGGSGLREVHGL